MRHRPYRRVAGPDLAGMPTHVAVARYPELLAVLRARGVDLAERGADRLDEAVDAPALAELQRAIGWRLEPATEME